MLKAKENVTGGFRDSREIEFRINAIAALKAWRDAVHAGVDADPELYRRAELLTAALLDTPRG